MLFVPEAAVEDEQKRIARRCYHELLNMGVMPKNAAVYDLNSHIAIHDAMRYDVVYFTGGSTGHLLRRLKQTGFDAIVKKMVFENKFYVGVGLK